MKTKKFISMLSLALGLLVSAFAFTACGSDDEENNDSSTNTLFGTWRAEVEEKGEIQYWEFTINSD
jgi:ABC-type glycerol-3-phosphate transport system substrate-binding protein